MIGLLLIPNALLCADFLMTARLSKLVDAALGPLPSVTDFVEFLRTSARRTGDVPAPDPVHGMLLQGVNAKPSGSARAEQTALARALEFVDVCAHLDAKYANLDAWFVGWGAWAIQAELLFDTEEKREECLAQRAATIASALAVGVQLKGSVCCPNVLLRASALPSHHTGQEKRVFEFFCIHEYSH